MEDDDEFGDLYTDVLLPFSQPLSSVPQPDQLSHPPSSSRGASIDLNLRSGDDDQIVTGTVFSNSGMSNMRGINQSLVSDGDESGRNGGDGRKGDLAGGSRVLGTGEVKSVIDDVIDGEGGKDVTFDIEDCNLGTGDAETEPIIPGISGGGVSVHRQLGNGKNLETSGRNDGFAGGDGGEGDDWDSDSEDDLQIVLNDNHGPMAVERGGVVGEDDEDGDPLVIVNDGDPSQIMEDQDWGEDAMQAADGERKEAGEAPKGNGGMVLAPKIGYSSHGYHPFHSQFKYIRPGAAPIPGAGPAVPGGIPGQVRPLVSLGPMAGRGRGDWRPPGTKSALPMQKSFHSGFGVPVWGSGRGLGGGLEFTLPSHKTIFEVDIDGFEEKPWRYPDIDTTDFFNFGLNEESWKDYSKQLEQLRLEATMQSKIRVYESGRTEQDYDPDLPPELAAATGVHDIQVENASLGKSDVAQTDLMKGSGRGRPPLPSGRAIQVEGGYGERLPSIDTRPPRPRDSDSIIEIVCQDSADDDSSTLQKDVLDQPDNGPSRDNLRGGHASEEDNEPVETEYFDGFTQTYNSRKRELIGRNTVHDNMSEGDGILPYPPTGPVQQHHSSMGQSPVYPGANLGSSLEERPMQGRGRERSPLTIPSRNTQDKKFLKNQKEESIESMDGKHSPVSSPRLAVRVAEESSVEHKDAVHNELVLVDDDSRMETEEMALNTITQNDTLEDEKLQSMKKEKVSSQIDDKEDSKAARSSENSKARSGSSRDYEKWRDSVEEEVVQVGHSSRVGSIKSHLDENEQRFRRKHDGRQEMPRNSMVVKGREDSYSHRDWDPNLPNHLQMKTEGYERRKERENPDGAWQRRDDDPDSRRIRTEIGSRHRGKVRESERSEKDEHILSRKQLDKSSYRIPYDKDIGSRHRERDDNLKIRYETVDDYHSKRRMDEQYVRRDRADKEEVLHGQRENTNYRKRERDDILDQQKRVDHQKVRDSIDDHHLMRHKDESWLQRDKGDRQREREDWHRQKQPHEENLSKRVKEEVRGTLRSVHAEDKAWISHARGKDEYKGSLKEYQLKDAVRHDEQLKRRDHTEDESLSHQRGREDVYERGNKFMNEEKRSRHERSSSRNERAVNAFDHPRVHEKKHRESTRKNKESEGSDHNTSKRSQEDQSGHVNKTGIKGTGGRGNVEGDISGQRHSSRKHKIDASSDDEQQDSRRGRSKLERWTSHKERDFNINSKTSSSLKFKEIDMNNINGSSEATKLPDESAKTVEAIDDQQLLADDNDIGDLEIKQADKKPVDDKHLDTVEKLKKRSERFKLPMRSDKESVVSKKVEDDPLPSSRSETPAESEVKQERPARKRRWIGN